MSKTSVKIIKNEIRCRDDTVPKTVDTRSHCKVWLRACNNLPQPPPYISVFWGCGRLLHALNHTLQWLLVSTVFGTVSSLHLISFLMIFTLVRCRDDTVPKTVDTRSHCKVWLRAVEDCFMLSTIPCSGFLYLQFLARCHPYIFFTLVSLIFP